MSNDLFANIRSDLHEIVMLIDRSGSMAKIRTDMEGGINTFIEEQKKAPGQALLSLFQFDDGIETVHDRVPIKDVGYYTLEPRGGTLLYGALGKVLSETGARWKAIPAGEKPSLVAFVIVTDGDNSLNDKEHTLASTKALREMYEGEPYKFQFTYLGCGPDAYQEAAQMGMAAAGSAQYTSRTGRQAMLCASANMTRMRTSASAGEAVSNTYTEDERRLMAGEDPPAALANPRHEDSARWITPTNQP